MLGREPSRSPQGMSDLGPLSLPASSPTPAREHQQKELLHGFAFNNENPHATEFLQRLLRGEDRTADRFRAVILALQNWERGGGNTPHSLIKAEKAVRSALESPPSLLAPLKLEIAVGLTSAPLPKFPAEWLT